MWPQLLLAGTVAVKAAAIVILLRIAVIDFTTQKIRNQNLVQLLAMGLSLCVLQYAQTGNYWNILTEVAAAALLFVMLIIFWLLRKLGAGDVKLLTVIPVVVGTDGSLTFALALLAFALVTYGVMKFPVLLPQSWLRAYAQHMHGSGRVPFGVPISAAAVLAILLPVSFLYLVARPSPIVDTTPPDFGLLSQAMGAQ
jgi:prepilin peptidase CpaA